MDKQNIRTKETYKAQKDRAINRGLEWLFDYDSWCQWWLDSGKWDYRGVKADQYAMCRNGDTGAYSPDNCYCDTNSNNTKYFHDNNPNHYRGTTKGVKKDTSTFYIYDGHIFEKQEDLVEALGYCLRHVQQFIYDGVIKKCKRIKGYKLYCTPYGEFKKAREALDIEPNPITRQAMFLRYKSDKPQFKDYYIKQVEPTFIYLN